MYCPKCGFSNSEETNFCLKCGSEISDINSPNQIGERRKINYYFDVIKKYAVFNGRSSRKEYWMFILINFLIYLGLGLIEYFIRIPRRLITGTYRLFIYIPSLAVAIRRIHDVGKSGWYFLIPIYSTILLLSKGTSCSNDYGRDPKLIE